MVSVCGSGGVDLSSYTGKLILHSSTLVRKKPCVGWGFQVDDVQVLGTDDFICYRFRVGLISFFSIFRF
jgi:hypothetical protein